DTGEVPFAWGLTRGALSGAPPLRSRALISGRFAVKLCAPSGGRTAFHDPALHRRHRPSLVRVPGEPPRRATGAPRRGQLLATEVTPSDGAPAAGNARLLPIGAPRQRGRRLRLVRVVHGAEPRAGVGVLRRRQRG